LTGSPTRTLGRVADDWEIESNGMSRTKVDFFVSYSSANERWAEWIAWVLEEPSFSVRLQAWDFAAGSNFVEMQRAAEEASRTSAVLSPAYFKLTFAAPESRLDGTDYV